MIVLIAKSGTGKDYIQNILKADYGFKPIVSYTTRDIRDGEVDGVNYQYVSKERFLELSDNEFFAEVTDNYGNMYGVANEDCNDDSIVIVEQEGLKQLMKNKNLNIISFYLHVPAIIRFKRMRNRSDSLSKIFSRLFHDFYKFKGAKKLCDYSLSAHIGEHTADKINQVVCSQDNFGSGLKSWAKNVMNKTIKGDTYE